MTKPEGYVSPGYLKKTSLILSALKDYTYEQMLTLHPKRILDAGCGMGVDTCALAGRSEAEIYGIDLDPDMIKHADELARSKGIAERVFHQAGDVKALPYEDGFFDACRAERLMQNLPGADDMNIAFHELIRVTRSGGRIVLADTDWASASLDFEDPGLERQMVSYFTRAISPNGYAARQFYRLFRQNHMRNISVELFPIIFMDIAYTPFGDRLTKTMQKNKAITDPVADHWLTLLTDKSRRGEFFCHVNMIVVSGTLP